MAEKPDRSMQLPAPPPLAEEATQTSTEAVVSAAAARTHRSTNLAVGETLGNRFKIIRLVALGGMGEVYEAVDLVLGARIAVKTLRLGIEGTEEQLDRLKREVLLARQITHPNICRIFEFFEGGTPAGDPVTFLTMEYLEGETLRSRLQRAGPTRPLETLALLRQMADGLGAIHSRGIVHRDFKSSNVMLVPDPEGERAVVMDFGIARQERETDTALTREGVVLGTPDYMAPEQRRGEDASVRSDVYAFGAVACEMVTGHLPVVGAAFGAGPHWRRVLRRALAADPEARYGTPHSMVEALETRLTRARLAIAIAVATIFALVGVAWNNQGLARLVTRIARRQEPSGTLTPRSEEIAQLHARGRELNRKLRWVEAVPVLKEVVRQQPSLVPAYLDLGDALAFSGPWKESTEIIQEAVRRAVGLPSSVRLAAEARYWKSVGDSQRAGEVARQLYELEPENTDGALLSLGLLDSGPALQFADRVREAHTGVVQDPRFDHLEAIASVRESNPRRALEALVRADEKTKGLDDRFLQVRTNLIRAYVELNDHRFGEATLALTTVEEFYEREGYRFDEAITIRRKAIGLWMTGAREEATSEGFRSMELLKQFGPSPELVNSSAILTMVLAIDGRLSVARKALQFAVGFPDNLLRQSPEFLFASAIVARAEADLPRAAAMIDTAVLGYTPSPTEWLAAKAAIYLDQDRLEELEQHMEEWLRRGRRELGPKERAVLGAVLLDVKIARGKPEEATTLFRVIPPEVRPEWGTESLVSESEIAILQKRPRRAVQLANQALRRAAHQFGSNSYEQARLQLARAYQAAGEPKQAASLLDALQVQATREGDKALELKLRLVRWEGPPTGRSRHRDELKQLEADATRAGLLRIAREAREAAAR